MIELDPIQLTRRLVDIESITFNEGAAGAFLADLLRDRGFEVECTPVPEPAPRVAVLQAGGGNPSAAPKQPNCPSNQRCNVYAGLGHAPDVVLSTHMDTVPPFFPSSEDETYIYGRGACDAKGIIAAQICAAEKLRAQGVRIGLLFVVGEERDSGGARLANQQPKGSKFLINGEPTDNRLALASKGALRAEIRAQGRMAHSAYPELGDSAIHKLVHALERLLALKLPTVEDVGPSTMNIGVVEGGHAPNVIADKAEALALIRLVGPSEPTKRAIEEAVADLAEVEFTLEIPFIRMKAIPGLETMVAAFTTDIPALSNWGEPLLLGPGSIHVAHTPQERLAKTELLEAVRLYTEVASRLVR